MSFLHTPRLLFSGDFLSDVSTINNDTAHYNNKTFKKEFQEPREPGKPNGWWNPEGGAVFDFQNCTVQQFVSKDGTVTTEGEFIGELIKGAEGRATGKMVDLDPQQQMCSQLWSVRLRIVTKADDLILEGLIEATGFRDLQLRQTDGGQINGQPLGGTWVSVLKNVVWGEKATEYDFFKELKETTEGDKLSINLNGFGYYYTHAEDGRFSLGKILGAIGPWFEGEPETFTPHRRLYGVVNKGSSPRSRQVYFSISNFLFDHKASRLSIDLGASFPITNSLGTIDLKADLVLAVSNVPLSDDISRGIIKIKEKDITIIATVDYEKGDQWLLKTCGIIDIENIPKKVADQLANNQLILLNKKKGKSYSLVARESIEGYVVRADNFVQRLDYRQKNEVNIYAYQWGNKLENGKIRIDMQPATPVSSGPICEIPGNNYPRKGVSFDSSLAVVDGLAKLVLTGNKIVNPRGYLDGQIYFLDYALIDSSTGNAINDPANGAYTTDNISIHLRDYFKVPAKPVWGDIKEIMTQFANLYPIMSKYFVDLSDPEALIEKKHILNFAFTRDIEDPIYMPVTRDLSNAKRRTIIKWLKNPIIEETADEAVATRGLEAVDEAKLMASPAERGKELTDKQKKLKMAVLAKNGALMGMKGIKKLKF